MTTSPRRLAFYYCDGSGVDLASPRDDLWACQGCFSCMPPTHTEILTRMDREHGCLFRLDTPQDDGAFYCGDPEADPYSNLCSVHGGHQYWTAHPERPTDR